MQKSLEKALITTVAEEEAKARLTAAAPALLEGCNALLGLILLLSSRDDIGSTVRAAVEGNHRVEEALAALAQAAGEPAP